MINTLRNIRKTNKEKIKVPYNVQEAIPVKAIYEDGIFYLDNNLYSMTFLFTDINYLDASAEDQEIIFLQYCDLLNTLDGGISAKLTINNRRLNMDQFKERLFQDKNDGNDNLRKEFNHILLDQIKLSNGIIQDKYLTITISKRDVIEARSYFQRIANELSIYFNKLGSLCNSLNALDRLRILHDFYRLGEETYFNFDIRKSARKGHDFKDYISPDSFEFAKDYFKMEKKFGRVLFLRDYASYLKDRFVTELCEYSRNLMLSLDLVPIPMDEAVKEVESRLLGVETNITNWQRRQNSNNNFSAVIPYDLELQRQESKEFLHDLTARDQRMMFGTLTLTHLADSKEELEKDTEAILALARKHLCQFAILTYQQYGGLQTALPIGLNKINTLRTLTTESAAVFCPFRAQEINHSNGVYYGVNRISKNPIYIDRNQLMNGNSFVLGVSGSGKSFLSKEIIVLEHLTNPETEILIIDPEQEYKKLVQSLYGEVIELSASSETHINAMDMTSDYAEKNPIAAKAEFILSVCEQLIGTENLGAKQKSIIDRCTTKVYRKYKKKNPTLKEFYEELLLQSEPEAKEIALDIELFVNGSLNTFAKPTNINVNNRLICFDIHDLGEQLQTVGMLVVLDHIMNRISRNKAKGINTYVYIDEIYLLFLHEYSALFLFKLWKRIRKQGGFCCGISQNVEDLLQSHTARTMLANSELVVMLKQATTDRDELAKLMNISNTQLSYLANAGVGQGLIKVGNAIVPFENKIPKNTKLYQTLTTKFKE